MKRVSRMLLNTISFLLIVIATIILIAVVINPVGTVPNICGYSFLRVVSGSMEPTIAQDELLLVKKCEASEIKEGEIITFYSCNEKLLGQLNVN